MWPTVVLSLGLAEVFRFVLSFLILYLFLFGRKWEKMPYVCLYPWSDTQKRAFDLLELELQRVVSRLT